MLISTTAIIAIVLWLMAFGIAMLVKRSPEVLCAGILTGYLFLPQCEIDLPGFTFDKLKIITVTAGCSVMLVDSSKRPRFRLELLDLPVLGLPVSTFVASMTNNLGAYDAFVTGLSFFAQWSVPWFVGRAVFSSFENARLLAKCIVLGAMIYVPFCIFEMKMAPVLHQQIYGYGARGNESLRGLGMRFGMWRPNVFTKTGLELSLFMGLASLIALWGRTADVLRRQNPISSRIAPIILGATTVLCVSTGATILAATGWLVILATRSKLVRLPMLILTLIPLCYPVYRMVNTGAIVINVESTESNLDQRKASLRARVVSEDIFLARWKLQPLFGWTSRYYLQTEEKAVPDSLWIQTLCKFGLAGWSCLTITLLLPAFQIWKPGVVVAEGSSAQYVLALCVLLFLTDCMFNAMENPVYVVMAGATVGMDFNHSEAKREASDSQPRSWNRRARTPWPRRGESGKIG